MTAEAKRQGFTPEFKKEAVALVTEQGYSVAKTAQAVDTREQNLRRWKKELKQVATGERLTGEERTELTKLCSGLVKPDTLLRTFFKSNGSHISHRSV
jgi:transposase